MPLLKRGSANATRAEPKSKKNVHKKDIMDAVEFKYETLSAFTLDECPPSPSALEDDVAFDFLHVQSRPLPQGSFPGANSQHASISKTLSTPDGTVAEVKEEFISFASEPIPAVTADVTKPFEPTIVSKDKDSKVHPYWISRTRRIASPLLRLHQEIVELCDLLRPTESESTERNVAVESVSTVVKSIWPNAQVHVFGSFATGLYVPTSDIDLVVCDTGCTDVQVGLKALQNAIIRKGIADTVQHIGKAKVPIIKFVTKEQNLSFDVSFDVSGGPEAARYVREVVDAWPPVRPLTLLLKMFLHQRELNEVYSGGIGSYALITMVVAFLHLHASRRPSNSRHASQLCLGTLLVDFCRLFGRVINMSRVGVSALEGGVYFRKDNKGPQEADWTHPERPYLLSVEDPQDPMNDIARGSFNIMRVKTAFEHAYQQLTAPAAPNESLLARILRLGPILASRCRPESSIKAEVEFASRPEPLLPSRSNKKRDREKAEVLGDRDAKRKQGSGKGGHTKAEARDGHHHQHSSIHHQSTHNPSSHHHSTHNTSSHHHQSSHHQSSHHQATHHQASGHHTSQHHANHHHSTHHSSADHTTSHGASKGHHHQLWEQHKYQGSHQQRAPNSSRSEPQHRHHAPIPSITQPPPQRPSHAHRKSPATDPKHERHRMHQGARVPGHGKHNRSGSHMHFDSD